MVLLILIFEVVVAFKIALGGFTPLGEWAKAQEICIDFALFAAISLLCQSLFLTSVWLLMPWQDKAQVGLGSIATEVIHLPAEYFLMLPLNAHRRLFGECAAPDTPPNQRSDSIFLKPFDPVDEALMAHFTQTDAWKMMQILHGQFRSLAPDMLAKPPSPMRQNTSSAALRMATARAEAMQQAEEGDASYHLMK